MKENEIRAEIKTMSDKSFLNGERGFGVGRCDQHKYL